MATPESVQGVKTNHSATMLYRYLEMLEDGVIDDIERAELLAMIQRNYGLDEIKLASERLIAQIERHPDTAPNKPLMEHLGDLVRVCSDIDGQIRPLVHEVELRRAA